MNILRRYHIISIILICIMVLPLLLGIFHSGFFVSDDGNWMVIRFSAFYQALREGQFPVRFLTRLNSGYGYPVSNFLYPGFLYLGIPLKVVGFNSLEVIKLLMAGFMISGAVFAYLWVRKLFDSVSSIAAALIYTYLPYHAYNLYERGSVGELMTLGIVPLLLWLIERRSYFFASIAFFLLIVSHNTLSLLFLPLVLGYVIVRGYLKSSIFFVITGFFLSSFFTIPALFDLQHTKFGSTVISNPSEYFTSFHLYSPGAFLIVVLSIVCILLTKIGRRTPQRIGLSLFFLSFFITYGFFASELSKPLWSIIPSSFVQFPFRLLSIVILCTSFLAGYSIFHLFPKFRIVTAFVLVGIVVLFSRNFIFPKEFEYKEIGFYDTNESLTTTHDEYMPRSVKSLPQKRAESRVEVFQGDLSIYDLHFDSDRTSFKVNAHTNGTVKINTLFFPGWSVSIDEENKITPFIKDDGLMYIPLLRGEHRIEATFSETPLRAVADLLSFVGIILLFVPLGKRVFDKVFK